jgi:nucleoside-diphosphate-sugar epimerase
MARRGVVLVTGAAGEVGHGLIHALVGRGGVDVLALDVREPDSDVSARSVAVRLGDIVDRRFLDALRSEFRIAIVFHLAARLSTRAEFVPERAHEINVEGTLNLLGMASEEARAEGRRIPFMFPSSIAVYGLPDVQTKTAAGRLAEDAWLMPTTMYVRFPGLVSPFTTPSGGTSDYAPEMLHAAAKGQPYACFVREDTRIPFMTMPDAVAALLGLLDAPAERLTRSVYNVTAFNPSAGELAAMVARAFPGARVTFDPDPRRQAIVDSWPADVDDTAARRDWGFVPAYDLGRAFDEYLVPNIRRRYAGGQ